MRTKKYAITYQVVEIRRAYVEAKSKEEAMNLFNEGDSKDDFSDIKHKLYVDEVSEVRLFPESVGRKYTDVNTKGSG